MTSFFIKLTAALAMTVDHTAASIGQLRLFPTLPLHTSYRLMNLMHGFGRLAFPLYAFLLAEGARKTRSMPRYIGRLFLFAVISEPFFYCALGLETPTIAGFWENVMGLNFGNVFFTLTIAACALYIYQILERKKVRNPKRAFLPVFLIAAFLSQYIGSDYGAWGVALIIALYFAETKPQKCAVLGVWSVLLYAAVWGAAGGWGDVAVNCLFAASSCLLVWKYNGKRGKSCKWWFYAYYPAHLLLLALLKFAI